MKVSLQKTTKKGDQLEFTISSTLTSSTGEVLPSIKVKRNLHEMIKLEEHL